MDLTSFCSSSSSASSPSSSCASAAAVDRLLSRAFPLPSGCSCASMCSRDSFAPASSCRNRSPSRIGSRSWLLSPPQRLCFSIASARAAVMENAVPAKQDSYTVGDFMTSKDELFVVKQSTTVDEALELLVENRITGLPVVDDAGKLIGVVSDYDLLALDSVSGMRTSGTALFPEADSTWKAFKEIQRLLGKTQGKTVGEVMTPTPLVVREMTNLEDAARLLLETKFRRLPVVDDSGRLIGLLTRGNVVRAALKIKRAAERQARGL